MLKLRASYGETGSDNLGTTLYGIVTTTREDVQFNNNSVTYIPYILSGANYEDVTWQKTVMKLSARVPMTDRTGPRSAN